VSPARRALGLIPLSAILQACAPSPTAPAQPPPVVTVQPLGPPIAPAGSAAHLPAPVFLPQRGHREGIWTLAWTADGAALVSGTNDHSIRVWEAATGRLRAVFTTDSYIVHSVAVRRADSRIVASSYMNVLAFDPHTGARLPAYPFDGGWVSAVALNPDGSILAGGGLATVRLWDVAGRHQIAAIATPRDDVRALAWSPDGTALAYAVGREIPIYDVATGTVRRTLGPHAMPVFRIAWHPDGTAIVSDGNLSLTVWDTESGKPRAMVGSASSFGPMTFSPDGTRFVGASGDAFSVRDGKTGAELITVKAELGGIMSLAFSPDGSRIAAGGGGGRIRVWEVPTGRPVANMPEDAEPIQAVQSASGARGLLLTTRRRASWWDLRAGKLTFDIPTQGVAALSDDGARIAVAGPDGVTVLDARSGSTQLTLSLPDAPVVSALAFGKGGELAVGLDESGRVLFFDLATQKKRARTLEVSSRVMSLAYRPDGKRIAVGTSHHGFVTADPSNPRTVGPPAELESSTIATTAWSPDQASLAVWRGGKQVYLCDGVTSKILTTIETQSNITAIAWGPGAPALAIAHLGGELELWDPASRTMQASISTDVKEPQSLSWLDSARFLAMAGADQLRILRLDNRQLLTLERSASSGTPIFVGGDGRLWCDDGALPGLVLRAGADLLGSPLMSGAQLPAARRGRDVFESFFSEPTVSTGQ